MQTGRRESVSWAQQGACGAGRRLQNAKCGRPSRPPASFQARTHVGAHHGGAPGALWGFLEGRREQEGEVVHLRVNLRCGQQQQRQQPQEATARRHVWLRRLVRSGGDALTWEGGEALRFYRAKEKHRGKHSPRRGVATRAGQRGASRGAAGGTTRRRAATEDPPGGGQAGAAVPPGELLTNSYSMS